MAQNILLICFLITLMLVIPKSSSTPTYLENACSNMTVFATKSRYQTNLNTIFGYLSSNAINPNGYHAAVAGNGTSDVVYGSFLCRGDQSPSSCQNCVSTATNTDLPKKYCPNSKVAIIWYDECMVRYSNVSFFGVLDQSIGYIFHNMQNITGNVSQFMDLTDNMMNSMVNRVVNGGQNKKFATNYTTYSSLQGIYGLEQCTPDLSASDCDQCLVNAVQSLPISKGGRTLWSGCNARFEVYPFFNGASNLTSPPAPPPSSRSNSTGKVPLPSPIPKKSKSSTKVITIVAIPVAILVAAFLVTSIVCLARKPKKNDVATGEPDEDIAMAESLQYDLSILKSATNNFASENKLGEGGFGSVYKGTLSNGEEIAVKRLARSSGQGAQEFKTELLLVAKLQHRNLARLLGFCLDGDEKLLVYEYASNKSLDNFVFDPIKQGQLNWGTRYNIIQGIARGILYLHQDSRLKVIHRDLKASNILLDANMNAKISDFGMARIFGGDQTQSNTSRVVGTFGYMAPEYVMHGRFSTKSDVYSFGVLVLEIISGKRNTSFYESGYAEDLLSYAWRLWQEGTPLVLVDEAIRDSCSNHEVMRCVHLGLLCVQDSVEARPTIETVVLSLDSFTVTLPLPAQPAFFSSQPAFFSKVIEGSDTAKMMVGVQSSSGRSSPFSKNDLSVSEMEPR